MLKLIEYKEPDFNKEIQINLTLGDFVMLFSGFGACSKGYRENFYKIHNISFIEKDGFDSDIFNEGERIIKKFIPDYLATKNMV